MPEQYFAFVESTESVPKDAAERLIENPGGLEEVLARREDMGLGPPRAMMWLDCIRADYFYDLEWRDEACEINNIEHASRRRNHLMDLDPTKFLVALLPIDPYGQGERDEFGRFNEMDWHLVQFDPDQGLPVLTASDFDFEPKGCRVLRVAHQRFADEQEYKSLRNVFSLDFLLDAGVGGRERPRGDLPPVIMPPDPGLAIPLPIAPANDQEML